MKDMQAIAQEINRYMAERDKLDAVAIYKQLKDTYPVFLMTDTSAGYEIPILQGESSAGKFELWDTGLDIIFEINKPGGAYSHWHPADEKEAVEAVVLFMQGICRE